MRPRFRIIREVLDSSGKGIVSAWVEKELTNSDRGKITARFNQIELNQTENPNWIKPYKKLKMWELRLSSGGKALRFLAEKVGTDVILVIGCVKRGQITTSEENQAKQRRDAYLKDPSNVRDYPLPERAPGDVEKLRR